MVFVISVKPSSVPIFQYSLCRVVLMVPYEDRQWSLMPRLSVLALSSRFDGPNHVELAAAYVSPFSTRSVESF